MTTTEITHGNHDGLPEVITPEDLALIRLVCDAVHRTDHRTDEILAHVKGMSARLAALEADWQAFKPIAEGFSRGGVLGARSAAKVARRAV